MGFKSSLLLMMQRHLKRFSLMKDLNEKVLMRLVSFSTMEYWLPLLQTIRSKWNEFKLMLNEDPEAEEEDTVDAMAEVKSHHQRNNHYFTIKGFSHTVGPFFESLKNLLAQEGFFIKLRPGQ
jgi:hypothetical protein